MFTISIDILISPYTFYPSQAIKIEPTLFLYVVPALLTTTSNRPNFENATSTTAFQSSLLVTSVFWNTRFVGFLDATFWPPSMLISATTTLAPSSAYRWDIAAPKPEPPPAANQKPSQYQYQYQNQNQYCGGLNEPVTMATLPWSRDPGAAMVLSS